MTKEIRENRKGNVLNIITSVSSELKTPALSLVRGRNKSVAAASCMLDVVKTELPFGDTLKVFINQVAPSEYGPTFASSSGHSENRPRNRNTSFESRKTKAQDYSSSSDEGMAPKKSTSSATGSLLPLLRQEESIRRLPVAAQIAR